MLLFRALQNCLRACVYAILMRCSSVYECTEFTLHILQVTLHNEKPFIVFLLFNNYFLKTHHPIPSCRFLPWVKITEPKRIPIMKSAEIEAEAIKTLKYCLTLRMLFVYPRNIVCFVCTWIETNHFHLFNVAYCGKS